MKWEEWVLIGEQFTKVHEYLIEKYIETCRLHGKSLLNGGEENEVEFELGAGARLVALSSC